MALAWPPRRAELSDSPKVRALTHAAYAKWVPVIGREPLPMTTDQTAAIRDHLVYLCEDNKELVAVVELIPKEHYLLIENLAVRPDQQGKGLGDRMLSFVEGFARSLGLQDIRLYTNAAFAANLEFYSRRGFVEYRRDTIVAGSTAVFMRRELKDNPT